RGGKAMIYEGGIREPTIVRYPRLVKAGGVCRVPIISDDFYPTMLDLAGLTPAEGKVLDGVSIVPLLKGAGTLDRDALFWHFPHYIAGYRPVWTEQTFWNTPSSAVRMGDWKLIEFYEGRLELYNLRTDPGERTDLSARHPGRVADMRKRLRAWLKERGAWLPIPNPRYDPAAKPPDRPKRPRARQLRRPIR
ncbi:MAG: sulfatase/phosphatase domain-containing protein, partial [Planctomycetota bacterium]